MSASKRVSLGDFARAVQETNPFQASWISRPDELRGDVTAIHGPEFDRMRQHIDEARRGVSCGVMLLGTAGCGKSHLIARLYRQVLEDRSVAPVFLHNLQASPERIPRYVLKATISSLSALHRSGGAQGSLLDILRQGLSAVGVDDDAVDAEMDQEILGVLKTFVELSGEPEQADLVSVAVEWLSGEEVDEDQSAQLTALAGRPIRARLPDAAAIERVIVVVTRVLATDGRALLLCLDQIDNLNDDQVGALTTFLHALIDHASHLLVICSGVMSTMNRLRVDQVVSEAAWDRVARHVIELQPVTQAQARQLVETRLVEFLAPFGRLKGLAAPRKSDALFPLGQAWFEGGFQGLQFRPRDVIKGSSEAWQRVRSELYRAGIQRWLEDWKPAAASPPESNPASNPATSSPKTSRASRPPLERAIRELVRVKVEERCAERLLNPASLPPDADNLAMLIRGLLATCAGWPDYSLVSAETPAVPRRGVRTFDLLVRERTPQGAEVTTGVVCIPGGHGSASTAALKRVQEDGQPLDHILVVSDKRRMFKPGPRGAEIYSALNQNRQRHFAHIGLELAEVAQLDALLSVLGLARVGDLEVQQGRGVLHTVTEAEAAAAMHSLDLFRGHPILRELLTEDARPVEAPPALSPLDEPAVRTLIAGFLSWRGGASATEVAKKAAQDNQIEEMGALLQQVIRVADEMHREGVIHVVPQDEDRYLRWLGTAA